MKTTPEFIIRKANQDDSEIIYEVKRNALGKYIEQTWGWDESLQRRIHADDLASDENIYMIDVEGTSVGTLGIVESDREYRVSRLYIIDQYQSKGIGRQIITYIIKNNSDKQIKLGVLKVNDRARKLYESLGFVVCGEENEHFKMIYKNR